MSFADFRVNERAFQLMEQVSGRAGRKGSRGRVMIQTSQPGHPILDFVVRHDYEGFFAFELEGRKRFHYPPFYRIIILTFRHKYKDRTEAAARSFANNLAGELGAYIIGPAEPVVNRVRQMYITELMLKLPKDAGLIRRARHLLAQQFAVIGNDKVLRTVVIDTNADPV